MSQATTGPESWEKQRHERSSAVRMLRPLRLFVPFLAVGAALGVVLVSASASR